MGFVLATLIGVASLAFSHAAWRFARTVRRLSDNELRSAWRRLDPGRRKAILRRMRRGEPVPGDEDAELALRAIAQVELVRTALRPVELLVLVLFAVVLVWVVSLGLKTLVIGGVLAGGVFALTGALSEWQLRRLRKSAQATRQVMMAERS